jgi:glutamate racemase
MPQLPRRVAMFDSGLGGLTVLGALRAIVSDIDVIYYADTAHVPYGDRTLEEVSGFATRIIHRLLKHDPGLIMIACGTTCSAFDTLGWPKVRVPLLGLIESGARTACAVTRNRSIGVVATNATARSGVFDRKILDIMPDARVTAVGAPALVPIVETGGWADARARDAVTTYCAALIRAGCDTAILGCTHYPHLMTWFSAALGPDVRIVDPGAACAQQAAPLLARMDPQGSRVAFEVSGRPDEFAANVTLLSGIRIDDVRRVTLQEMEQAKK